MDIEKGFQVLSRLQNFSTFEGVIPSVFKDGLHRKDVIELYGGEGTGKSEILLNVVAAMILPKIWKSIHLNGKDAHVIYIDNDYKFSMIRLVTIIESKIYSTLQEEEIQDEEIRKEDIENLVQKCLSNLTLIRCSSSSELLITLYGLNESMLCDPNLAMILIDSISAFYWIDKCNGGESLMAQEKNMMQITEVLQKLIKKFDLIIIATKCALFKRRNQDYSANNKEQVDHQEFLCRSWGQLVTHRFLLEKQALTNSILCHCIPIGSSEYDRSVIQFKITENGIQ
ncbi:DNA repair protein XRCC2-like isoform X2 [Crassostrea virginica]